MQGQFNTIRPHKFITSTGDSRKQNKGVSPSSGFLNEIKAPHNTTQIRNMNPQTLRSIFLKSTGCCSTEMKLRNGVLDHINYLQEQKDIKGLKIIFEKLQLLNKRAGADCSELESVITELKNILPEPRIQPSNPSPPALSKSIQPDPMVNMKTSMVQKSKEPPTDTKPASDLNYNQLFERIYSLINLEQTLSLTRADQSKLDDAVVELKKRIVHLIGEKKSSQLTVAGQKTLNDAVIVLNKLIQNDLAKLPVIGSGSFGKIYQLENLAIKVEDYSKSLSNDKDKRNAERGGVIQERMMHPNVLSIHQFSVIDKGNYLITVMDKMEKTDLEKLLKNQQTSKIPIQIKETIARQVGSALQGLHARNIVHFDIKPAQVMFEAGFNGSAPETVHVRLGDFGMAIDLDGDRKGVSDMCGTPYYLAPEIINSERNEQNAKASDVWAFGVTLVYMLSGTKPFTGRNLHELCQTIKSGMWDKPSIAHAPTYLKDIAIKCLSTRPGNRPTMDQIVQALDTKQPII